MEFESTETYINCMMSSGNLFAIMNRVMLQAWDKLPAECQSMLELLQSPIADQKEVLYRLTCCWKKIDSLNRFQVILSHPYRATICLVRAYNGVVSSDDVGYFVLLMTEWLGELEGKQIFQNSIAEET